jgi:hypothetical protein
VSSEVTVSRRFPSRSSRFGADSIELQQWSLPMSAAVNDLNAAPDDDLLTDEDVVARYRGRITLGTLRNWRALKIGPPYIKVGKAVLYSRNALQAWDKRNTVTCSKIG